MPHRAGRRLLRGSPHLQLGRAHPPDPDHAGRLLRRLLREGAQRRRALPQGHHRHLQERRQAVRERAGDPRRLGERRGVLQADGRGRQEVLPPEPAQDQRRRPARGQLRQLGRGRPVRPQGRHRRLPERGRAGQPGDEHHLRRVHQPGPVRHCRQPVRRRHLRGERRCLAERRPARLRHLVRREQRRLGRLAQQDGLRDDGPHLCRDRRRRRERAVERDHGGGRRPVGQRAPAAQGRHSL